MYAPDHRSLLVWGLHLSSDLVIPARIVGWDHGKLFLPNWDRYSVFFEISIADEIGVMRYEGFRVHNMEGTEDEQ